MSDKKIRLIEPPIEYGDDDEANKPCHCGSRINNKTKLDNLWPDPKVEVGDED